MYLLMLSLPPHTLGSAAVSISPGKLAQSHAVCVARTSIVWSTGSYWSERRGWKLRLRAKKKKFDTGSRIATVRAVRPYVKQSHIKKTRRANLVVQGESMRQFFALPQGDYTTLTVQVVPRGSHRPQGYPPVGAEIVRKPYELEYGVEYE